MADGRVVQDLSAARGQLHLGDAVFSEDVVFTDPERVVRGRDDLATAVTGLLAQGPGFVFTHDGPFRGAGDLGMRAWALGPPDGQPVLRGVDVVIVADGQITKLWTMLEA